MGNSESLLKATWSVVQAEGEKTAREKVKETTGWLIDNSSVWGLTGGAALSIGLVVFVIFIAYNVVRVFYNNFWSAISQIVFGAIIASVAAAFVWGVEWVFILWWGWT